MPPLDISVNLQPALQILQREINPYAIYLFGSAVRNRMQKNSDIDLAFLTDHSPSSYTRFLIAQKIAQTVHRDVDLIDLSTVDTVLCAQVVSTGRLLFNGNKIRVAEFHIRTLKEYAMLNEERACILEKILAKGNLHA